MTARTQRNLWSCLLGAALLVAQSSCTLNPATGQRQLTLMSEQQEIAVGRDADQQIREAYGVYPDQALQTWAQDVGSRLAASSERPHLPWTFAVLDDPTVNAFALPGGYIYLTRGILTHFNSEAEAAGVLGHEIGHVTARHSVEQMSRAQLAGVGLTIASAVSEEFREYGGLAEQASGLLFLKFSRDDERQSDDLGLRYLSRGGYDPNQLPMVFQTLNRVSQAQGGGRIPVWLSTHPNPENRSQRIVDQISALPEAQRSGKVERDSYLQRLQGMIFGDNPREGYLVGSVFYHPQLEFQLTFPAGWQVVNQRQAVNAVSPEQDGVLTLSLAEGATPGDASRAFFERDDVEQLKPWRQGYDRFRTRPQPAGGGAGNVEGVVTFFSHKGRIFRLLGYASSTSWPGHQSAIQKSMPTFKTLTSRPHLDVTPKKVEIVRLPQAMTLAEFQQRYPSTVDQETLAIANGVGLTERFERGRLVKRIVGGKLPAQ